MMWLWADVSQTKFRKVLPIKQVKQTMSTQQTQNLLGMSL